MKKILIVDDHPAIRLGLGGLIVNHFAGYEYMEAENGNECIQLARNHNFELIILDINIPNTNVLDLIDWMLIHNSESRIMIFSTYPYTQYGIQYYKKGVMGYINKDADKRELLRAIELILSNRIYMAQEFQDVVSGFLHKKKVPDFALLSEREFAVAQCLAKGMKYEDIAQVLHVSVSTIRSFKLRIFRKLGVKTLFDFLTLIQNDQSLGNETL